ncbi:hypothetical protein GF354_02350 [Candidatus Peregrinibacteria bacterium]|nr:hypothetical protein [Candidatus Peregrinibacteria bacterium]
MISKGPQENLVKVDFVRKKRISHISHQECRNYQEDTRREVYNLLSDFHPDFLSCIDHAHLLMELREFDKAAETFREWRYAYPEAMFFEGQCMCISDLNNVTKIHSGLLLVIRALIKMTRMCKREDSIPEVVRDHFRVFTFLLDIAFDVKILKRHEIFSFPAPGYPVNLDYLISELKRIRGLIAPYLKPVV